MNTVSGLLNAWLMCELLESQWRVTVGLDISNQMKRRGLCIGFDLVVTHVEKWKF